jgi:hypothetical protein
MCEARPTSTNLSLPCLVSRVGCTAARVATLRHAEPEGRLANETDHAAARRGVARVVRLQDDSWTGRSVRANADARRARTAGAG